MKDSFKGERITKNYIEDKKKKRNKSKKKKINLIDNFAI